MAETVYSYSRLNKFENCPLQYRFIYIDKIKREKEGIEAFTGARFHDVMEKLYKDLPFKTDSLAELLDYYDKRWREEYHDDIVVVREDRTVDDYKALGRKCVKNYYRRYDPFDQGKVIGVEREVRFALDESGTYRILGYIDRLDVAPDGSYEIHDYKTSVSLPEQKALDEDRQLALYQIGIEKTWRDIRAVRLVWHYVALDKEMASTRTREDLEMLKTDISRLIDKIEATTDFEPHESMLCDWCLYWDLCPKKRHLAKIAVLPENEFRKEAGVKLVDAFAGLTARKRDVQKQIDDIEAELEKVKEAVVEYATKERADVLRGTSSKLRVAMKRRIGSPAKGTKERTALESVLRECGVWEEISGLDPFALEKAVAEKKWDKSILDRILRHLAVETKYSVTLAALKDKDAAGCNGA